MENGKCYVKEVIDFSIREISSNEKVIIFICDTKQHAEELLSNTKENEIIYFQMIINDGKVSFLIRQSNHPNIDMIYETGYKYSEYKPFEWILNNQVKFFSTGYYIDDKNTLGIITNYICLPLRIK
jgi:hypothetical protein